VTNAFKIGEVAKEAGVNLQTLYFYERRGLLGKPPRNASNYRLYTRDALRRVLFIKHARELGFTLEEIKELLSLQASQSARCADVQKRAKSKLQDMEEKIRSLRKMRNALGRLIDECSGQGPASECPLLDALDSEEELYVEG
jgi:MerR family copper efflux transcriptional regulator